MKTLGLNRDNDIYLNGGGFAEAVDIDAQRIIIETLLLTQKGELQFDDEAGIDYFGTVLQSPTYIEPWAREVQSKVEDLPFVGAVENFEYRFDAKTSTLYWSMQVLNTDGKTISFDNRSTRLDGSPGVDVKWDDIYNKPDGAGASTEMVQRMVEAALEAVGTDGQLPDSSTLREIKNIINSVLLDSQNAEEIAKKNITFTFKGVAAGTVIDLSNLHIESTSFWTAEFNDGSKLWFSKDNHKIVTEKRKNAHGEYDDVFTYMFKKRGVNTLTIHGSITEISCSDPSDPEHTKDTVYPIFMNSAGTVFPTLAEVTIGSKVPLAKIGKRVFAGFGNLSTITWNLNPKVTSMTFADYAFEKCSRLYDLTWIPQALSEIGEGCFSGCSSLVSIEGLPTAITNIPDRCFYGCTSLTNLSGMSAGITSIGASAFEGCTSIGNIEDLPPSLTTIEDRTFADCTGLETILYPPEALTNIGVSAFDGCTSLRCVYIPKKVVSIGARAFAGCTVLDNIFCDAEEKPTVSGDTFEGTAEDLTVYVYKGQLDQYIGEPNWGNVPAVKNYGEIEFQFRDLGEALNLISGTSTLTSDSIWILENGEGAVFRYERTVDAIQPISIPASNGFLTLSLRGYVTEIGALSSEAYPFLATVNATASSLLKKVDVFDSPLEVIGDFCFAGNTGLSSITLWDWDGHGYRLGERAFQGCTSLSSTGWIKPGIGLLVNEDETTEESTVYYDAFGAGCFENSGIADLNFAKDSSLQTSRIVSYPEYCFAGTKIINLEGIGSSEVVGVGAHCFDGCAQLQSIEELLSTSIQFLPDYCFANCSALTSIRGIENIISTQIEWADDDGDGTYTANRTTILGTHLFENCTALTTIKPLEDAYFTPPSDWSELVPPYSAGIEDLSDYMFCGCSAIENLDGLSERIHSLGVHCFDGCEALTYRWDDSGELLLPIEHEGVSYSSPLMPLSWTQVTALPEGCFANCTGLLNLLGLDKITSIGDSCFADCTNLLCTSGCGDSLASIGSLAFENCTGMQYATFLSATPPSISSSTFSGSSCGTIPLYVKPENESTYKGMSGWRVFGSIEHRSIILSFNGVSQIDEEQANNSLLLAQTLWSDGKYIPGLYFVEYGDGSKYSFYGDQQLMLSPHEYASRGNYEVCIYGDIREISAGLQGVPTQPSDIDMGVPFLGSLAENVTSISIESSYLENVGAYCFKGYTRLSHLTVRLSSGGAIGAAAFAKCSSLRYLTECNAGTLGFGAFLKCVALENVSALTTVTTLGDFCFAGDIVLTELAGLSNVSTIGRYCFSGCTRLASTQGLSEVQTIGEYAFAPYDAASGYGPCAALTEATGFTDTLQEVGNHAFAECPIALASVAATVPPLLGEDSFDQATYEKADLYVPLTAVSTYQNPQPVISGTRWDGSTDNYWSKFQNIKARHIRFTLKEISKGDFLVGGVAVVEANGAWSISYGDEEDVQSFSGTQVLGGYTFKAGSDDDKDIILSGAITGLSVVSSANPFFVISQSGGFTRTDNLVSMDATQSFALTTFGENTFKGSIGLEKIGDLPSITSIGASCFESCTALTDVSGLSSVTSIGASAFKGCSKLENLNGLASVETIGTSAFENCTALTKIDGLGMNVDTIGDRAFYNCRRIAEVQMFAITPPALGDNVFSIDKSVVPLYVLNRSLSAYSATTSGWSDFSTIASRHILLTLTDVNRYSTIVGNCGKVESNTFWAVDYDYSNSLDELQLFGFGSDVENFPAHYFEFTGGDFQIRIEGNVIGIKGTSITAPFLRMEYNGVKTTYLTALGISDAAKLLNIGDYAFYGDSSLSSVAIPSVTGVGPYAFTKCKALTELTGFSGLQTIDEYAFDDTGLANLAGLGTGIISIGKGAFGNLTKGIAFIQIAAVTPPILDVDAFVGSKGPDGNEIKVVVDPSEGTYYTGSVPLYVPASSVSTYQTTVPWSYFKDVSSRSIYIKLTNVPEDTVFNRNDSYPANISADGAWTIDWGDGSPIQTLSASVQTIPQHTYQDVPSEITITLDGAIKSISGSGDGTTMTGYRPLFRTDDQTTNPYITEVVCSPALEIENIGNFCFAGCVNLRKVTGFEKVTGIGTGAFYNCSALSQIGNFPSLTTISNYGFAECGVLSSVSCFPNIKTLGDFAFYNDSNLFTIAGLGATSGASDTLQATFGSSCFAGCSLRTIETDYKIPPEINATTFDGTSYEDTPVYVPMGTIEAYKAASIWQLYLNISELCFINFTFKDIKANDSIWSPWSGANYHVIDCRTDWSIDWGDGTVSRKKQTDTQIPASSTSHHCHTYAKDMDMVTISLKGNFSSLRGDDGTDGYPFLYVHRGNDDTKSLLSAVRFRAQYALTSIGKNAFTGCTELQEVTSDTDFPALTEIGDTAFFNCTMSKKINLNNTPTEEVVEGDCLIPEAVTNIGEFCFSGCEQIKKVDWAYDTSSDLSTRTAGASCFESCTNLRTVVRFGGITEIPNYAFYKCTRLTDITPNGIVLGNQTSSGECTVTAIGDWAFARCINIGAIILPYTVKSIGVAAFGNSPYLDTRQGSLGVSNIASILTSDDQSEIKAKLIESANVGPTSFQWEGDGSSYYVASAAFIGNDKMEITSLPSTLWGKETTGPSFNGLPSSVFLGCRRMTNFKSLFPIDREFDSINAFAFAYTGISSLTNAVFAKNKSSQGVTNYLSEGMFMGCENLTSLSGIPVYITQLGSTGTESQGYCFAECTSLQTLSALTNVTEIYQGCFAGCTSLTELDASDGNGLSEVTIYPERAFYGCTSLRQITMPATQITFENDAFGACPNITAIKFPLVDVEPMKVADEADPFSGLTTTEKAACMLLVPYNMVLKYKRNTYWMQFNVLSDESDYELALTAIFRGGTEPFTLEGHGSIQVEPGHIGKTCGCIYWGDGSDKVELVVGSNNTVQLSSLSHTYTATYSKPQYTMRIYCNNMIAISGTASVTANLAITCSPFFTTRIEGNKGINDRLNYVEISSSTINTIGAGCFSSCTELANLIFSEEAENNIQTLGDCAFFACHKNATPYKSLTVIKSVGKACFANVDDDTFLDDLDKFQVSRIPSGFFFHQKKIDMRSGVFNKLSSTVTIIDSYAFTNVLFSSFTYATNTNYLHVLFNAFQGNTSLTDLGTLKLNLDFCGGQVFANCTGLSKLKVGDEKLSWIGQTIPGAMFRNCTALEDVSNLPDGTITTLGNGAFRKCQKLDFTTLPKSILHIGKDDPSSGSNGYGGVFEEVSNSSQGQEEKGILGNDWSVIFPNLQQIGPQAFKDSNIVFSFAGMPNSVTTIGDKAFFNNTNLKSIDAGDALGIESIGTSAFESCTNLSTIAGLTNVSTIGEACFKGCAISSLPAFSSLLLKLPKDCFRGCKSLTSLQGLSSYVIELGESCFQGCTGLTSLQGLPASVMALGDSCFRECNNLESVEFPTGTQLNEIPQYCFAITRVDSSPTTDALEEVVLPESMETLKNGCFNGRLSITSIKILRFQEIGNQIEGTAIIDTKSDPAFNYVTLNASYGTQSFEIIVSSQNALDAYTEQDPSASHSFGWVKWDDGTDKFFTNVFKVEGS